MWGFLIVFSFKKKSWQEEDVCCISVSSEEDIIFEKEISVEIGHGSVLMKNPPSFAREEVTKTSSLSSVWKQVIHQWISDAYSHSLKRVDIGAIREIQSMLEKQ